jgi:adenosine kinase
MKIILTGSVAYDYLMSFPGHFRDHILPDKLETISLSFLVDSMVRLRGGVAPNIAYTLALLGQHPILWATVGEDFAEYRHWLERMGVDTSGARVIPGVYTASFFANTDRDNNQIASFYPGAMAYAAQLSLHDLRTRPDLVLISPNDPEAMKLYVKECQELQYPYLYDPSQQIVRLTGEEITNGIQGCLALFVNDYESALIEKMTGFTPEMIANRENAPIDSFVVVTRGSRGADIITQSQNYHIPVVPQKEKVDPTGVGDAFRGGFLAGYANHFDLLTCGKMGALAATYCIEHRGPQTHHYTVVEFVDRFRQFCGESEEIDNLIENQTITQSLEQLGKIT